MKIAMLTPAGFSLNHDSYSGFAEEAALLMKGLVQQQVDAEIVNWQGNIASLRGYDAIWLQSYSKYQEHYSEFQSMLDALQSSGLLCLNSPSLIRWNSHKGYLRQLAEKGCATLPTHWFNSANAAHLQQQLASFAWQDIVIKPAISAGAWHTTRLSLSDAEGGRVGKPNCLPIWIGWRNHSPLKLPRLVNTPFYFSTVNLAMRC